MTTIRRAFIAKKSILQWDALRFCLDPYSASLASCSRFLVGKQSSTILFRNIQPWLSFPLRFNSIQRSGMGFSVSFLSFRMFLDNQAAMHGSFITPPIWKSNRSIKLEKKFLTNWKWISSQSNSQMEANKLETFFWLRLLDGIGLKLIHVKWDSN